MEIFVWDLGKWYLSFKPNKNEKKLSLKVLKKASIKAFLQKLPYLEKLFDLKTF